MNEKNDSFLEMAHFIMKKKKKPQSLDAITKEVFGKKGIKGTEQEIAQFQVDFMLCGYFICCGEDKDNIHLWDLKSRQPSALLDKDGGYLEDLYADDEDVIKNELKDDFDVLDDTYYDDEDEEDEETDDIAEEFGFITLDEDGEAETSEASVSDDEDEDEEAVEEDDLADELEDI